MQTEKKKRIYHVDVHSSNESSSKAEDKQMDLETPKETDLEIALPYDR